ncbi:hypothetical protein PIB30_084760 [Stylosanthes scabra]|uniref:Myb/SANT-like domain-containing protein n=1 Tax=Stylosanthes scabra TaxID=79078 RepID=A0ABU6ZR90_9FABA|nr:hypothetical protein [Stylosanthes scabra]
MDKRMWSEEETEAFVGFMEEVVAEGPRPDCGQFRQGTFEKLALKMIERGFGWNVERQCIDVDSREVLESWIKAHSKKFYTPGKPFPMFERLGRIFGKDRATGSAAVSGFDAEEQLGEELDDEVPTMDDYFMSSEPTATGPDDTPGNAGQGTTSSVDRTASTRRLFDKKRKHANILERMADEVHESTAAQREHLQILANAISGKNDEVKMGEKLAELGFADHDAIQVVVKIYLDSGLEKSFWGLTDAQKTTIAQDVLDGKY